MDNKYNEGNYNINYSLNGFNHILIGTSLASLIGGLDEILSL